MKREIVFLIFVSLFLANVTMSFAGGHFPPNGKKCEVGGKVIYVDKTCMTNLGWREMLWTFENQPKEFSGLVSENSVSENCVDSTVWKRVYGEGIGGRKNRPSSTGELPTPQTRQKSTSSH